MRLPRYIEHELSKEKSSSTTKIELSRRISHESSSTENDVLVSPGIEINPPLGGSLNIPTHNTVTAKKSKRGSFIHKKFNLFGDSKPKKQQQQNENFRLDFKRQQHNSTSRLASVAGTPDDSTMTPDPLSGNNSSSSRTYRNRPSSLDISSVTIPLSTWEGFGGTPGRYKKMSVGSEDEMSDTYSVPGMVDDNKDRIEEALREDTLLRKRRNSLTLERGQITMKLEALREAENIIANTINNNNNNISNNNSTNSKKHSKHSILENRKSSPDLVIEQTTEQKKEKMNLLEKKLENIDNEIDDIEKRIFSARVLASDDKHWTTSTQLRPSGGRPLSRLRPNLKPRALHDFHSQSIESLSSSVSRESTMSRDTIDSIRSTSHSLNHQQFPGSLTTNSNNNNRSQLTKSKSIAIPLKTPDSSDEGGIASLSSPNALKNSNNSHSHGSQFSGIEELLMTTQRLENSSSSNHGDSASQSHRHRQLSPAGTPTIPKDDEDTSPIWRSKSMGSMELMKSRSSSMRMDINQNNESAKTIIEVIVLQIKIP